MFEPKIKIRRELYARLAKLAETRGYSSTDEFVLHILDQAAREEDESLSEEQVRERLKGLGYLK
jgi:hypothetical protein